MTRLTASAPAPIGLASRDLRPTVAQRALRLLHHWSGLRRSRSALGQLDARLLRDIGLDPSSAGTEASRPFWR